ncbi:MAG: hypothetical protein Unbinned5336contig1001_14 [Prokaryotic dsDNA virus sp.]|nr:MAG: hypothetical protein Unbinned5336contig1001_14 [Prokaryotic dsDNA virus sp.]|tara:strand:- start:9882 stop:10238 length:357 start_codon:yes stop_codon:yes gene_type:complete
MSEKKKKKKGLGGKKPNSRRQLMKTLAHYRGKGIPLGFIQDSIISGYGETISNPLKMASSIAADRGGWKPGMGYTRKMTNLRTGAVTKTPKKITRSTITGAKGTRHIWGEVTKRDVAI